MDLHLKFAYMLLILSSLKFDLVHNVKKVYRIEIYLSVIDFIFELTLGVSHPLWENPSLEKRGTYFYSTFSPFSF